MKVSIEISTKEQAQEFMSMILKSIPVHSDLYINALTQKKRLKLKQEDEKIIDNYANFEHELKLFLESIGDQAAKQLTNSCDITTFKYIGVYGGSIDWKV